MRATSSDWFDTRNTMIQFHKQMMASKGFQKDYRIFSKGSISTKNELSPAIIPKDRIRKQKKLKLFEKRESVDVG